MREAIYKELAAELQQIRALKWIDWDFGQLSQPAEQYPVPPFVGMCLTTKYCLYFISNELRSISLLLSSWRTRMYCPAERVLISTASSL